MRTPRLTRLTQQVKRAAKRKGHALRFVTLHSRATWATCGTCRAYAYAHDYDGEPSYGRQPWPPTSPEQGGTALTMPCFEGGAA